MGINQKYYTASRRMPRCSSDGYPIFIQTAAQQSAFLQRFPFGRCLTEMVSLQPEEVVFKCSVYRTLWDRMPVRTAYASQRADEPLLYKSSHLVECAEASAISRALDSLGFGADYALFTAYCGSEPDFRVPEQDAGESSQE